jgi:hypothetical protein
VEEKKVEEEEKEEESVKDAEYRPPVTSSRGVVSALDSLPPEEREKLLAARWDFDHSFQHLFLTIHLNIPLNIDLNIHGTIHRCKFPRLRALFGVG